ncbi:MAG: hypothetical protein JXR78_11385 [Victivallales bacterium]|nr:hypothetical protein [Victivallales bacterium]
MENYIVRIENDAPCRVTVEAEEAKKKKAWTPQDIAYYQCLYTEWFSGRSTLTKFKLTLSSAGLGVLLTIGNSFSFNSKWGMIILCVSAGSFLATILIALLMMEGDAELIDVLIDKKIAQMNFKKMEKFEETEKELSSKLHIYDILIYICFFIAVITMILVTAISITNKPLKGEMKNVGQISEAHSEAHSEAAIKANSKTN